MKRIEKPVNIKKIVKIQSFVRGFFVRSKYKNQMDKIRREAPKKTDKYKKISKLQANIKGWLFRQRRKRLLAKLGIKTPMHQKKKDTGGLSQIDEMFGIEGDDDFDAEAFFGIKEENLESNMVIGEDLM